MGAARLLAKGWMAFCLFTGAHALAQALARHMVPEQALSTVGITVALFGAMGLLFIAGYGATSGTGGLSRLSPGYFLPGFNEIVFLTFASIIFAVQIGFVPQHGLGGGLGALETAVQFAIPGQGALESIFAGHANNGSQAFASAIAWLLAFIFLGSGLSRIRMGAALLRLERKRHAETLGALPFTFLLGLAAVLGFQLLVLGTVYAWVPYGTIVSLPGAVLIGLAPLAWAYLVIAALTNALALSPEA